MNEYYVVDTTEKCSKRFMNLSKEYDLEFNTHNETSAFQTKFTLGELEAIEKHLDVNILNNKQYALLPVDLLHEYKMGRSVTIPFPLKVGDLSCTKQLNETYYSIVSSNRSKQIMAVCQKLMRVMYGIRI